MHQKYFFYTFIGFFLIIIFLKNSHFEKFSEPDIILSKKRTKCEQCCNQLQQSDVCSKKCIFEGAVCRCCENNNTL